MDDGLKEIPNEPDSDREYIKELFECVFPKEKLIAKGGRKLNVIFSQVWNIPQ